MKIEKISIEGFNSFQEKQTIDFSPLIAKGIFGIFGPTGSGKTSIMDAIIYSLYGKIPRDTKDVVNASCKTATLDFIFSIKGNCPGRYQIIRQIQANRKGDQVSTTTKKVTIKNLQTDKIIAEGPSQVNDKIGEIIGLNYDEFTKTVVLPQGEFSSFIKTTGVNKQKMLQKMFNITQYGDELEAKVKSYKKPYSEKEIQLKGTYQIYQDLDKKDLENLTKELQESKKIKENLEEKLNQSQDNLNKAKHTYDLTEKIQDLEEKIKTQEEIKPQIEEKKTLIKQIQDCQIIQGNLSQYKKANQSLNQTTNAIKEIKTNLENQNKELETLETNHKKTEKSYQEIPNLKLKINEKQQTIEKIKKIQEKQDQKTQKETTQKETKAKIENYTTQENKIQNEIKEIKEKIKDTQNTIKENTVTTKERNQIQTIKTLKENYEKEIKEKTKIQNNLDTTANSVKENEKAQEIIETQIKKLQNQIQDTIQKENKDLRYTKEGLDKFSKDYQNLKDSIKERDQIKNRQNQLTEENKAIENSQIQVTKEIEQKEKELEKIQKELEEKEKQNLIHNLKSTLHQGDICPICSNKIEHLEFTNNIQDLTKEKEKKEQTQKELNTLKAKLLSYGPNKEKNEIELNNLQKQMQDLLNYLKEQKLDKNFQERTLEALEINYQRYQNQAAKIQADNEKIQEQVKTLQDELNKQNIEKAKKETQINANKTQIKDLKETIDEKNQTITKQKNNIESIKEELQIQDIDEKINEQNKKDQIIEKATQLQEQNQKNQEIKENDLKIVQDNLKKENEINTNIQTQIQILDTEIKNLRENLKQTEEISEIERQIQKEKENIQTIEKTYNDEKTKIQNLKEKISENQINEKTLENTKTSAIQTIEENKPKLEQFIKTKNYESLNQIDKILEKQDQKDSLKNEIDNYTKELENLKSSQKTLKDQIPKDQEIITKEKLLEITESHNQLQEQVQESQKQVNYKEAEINKQKDALEEKAKLEKEIKENKKVLEEIEHLETLFKGKAFVKFLSSYHLHYICMDANKMLSKISNNSLEITLGSDNEFIIKDLKNNSALRDPKSLSGGETFQVSLALALALTSKIQLKGAAPLEFFFLDEGFGTLDNQSLEIALTTLEKLKTQNKAIGIISHVEKIQNFVPIKIQVIPPQIGQGGSKVKIDLI